MSLKTIVVHVDDTERCYTRIRLAAQLALEHEAHVMGVAATGWSPMLMGQGFGDPILPVAPADAEPAKERCARALAAFETLARSLNAPSLEARLVEEEAGLALALHGLCSDLIIVGQTRGGVSGLTTPTDVPEWLMLNSPVPVLVVPAHGEWSTVGTRIAVAWNGSNEARRAIGTALPLLCKADKVHLLMINAQEIVADAGDGPGAEMGRYLARQGVNAEIDIGATRGEPGEELVRASADCGVDLLVMGANGRPRLRELLMGGASRTVLASMQVPVWMAH